MKNKERIDKLKQAELLIRDVEFSYDTGHPVREGLFTVVVNTFAMGSYISTLIPRLKLEIELAKREETTQ